MSGIEVRSGGGSGEGFFKIHGLFEFCCNIED
jgi:hypothetical protein